MEQEWSTNLEYPWLGWAKDFKARCFELFGKNTTKKQWAFRKASELLDIPVITIYKWVRGETRPSESRWITLGVFMGWITFDEEGNPNKEGVEKTIDYFCSDRLKSDPLEAGRLEALKRSRARKRRRK